MAGGCCCGCGCGCAWAWACVGVCVCGCGCGVCVVVVWVVCCFLFSEVKFLDVLEDELPRNHLPRMFVIDHERRLGELKTSTVVVLTKNHAD